jgi:hypothetical protein
VLARSALSSFRACADLGRSVNTSTAASRPAACSSCAAQWQPGRQVCVAAGYRSMGCTKPMRSPVKVWR